MAGTLTHNKFAHDLYPKIKSLDIDKDYFIIGNQGHDLLIFIRLWEYPLKRQREDLIDILQEIDVNKLAKLIKGKSRDVKSFMYGYLAHELLDQKTHPYINDICNYDDHKHAFLESIIDYKINNNMININKYLPRKVKITKEFKKEISAIFDRCFHNDIYAKIIFKNINNVTHFIKLYRLDKTGIKRIGYRLINKKKFAFLAYNYRREELNFALNDFLKIYNKALKEVEVFLKKI